MSLTPAELAWQELVAVRLDIATREPVSERHRQRRWSLCEAYQKVLAQVPGTSATFEPDKVGFKAERIVSAAIREHAASAS